MNTHELGVRAGEIASAFERVWSVWASVTPGRSSRPDDWAAFVAACRLVEPARLERAIGRYLAEDPDVGRKPTRCPAMAKWLASAKWEPWLMDAPAPAAAEPLPPWDGPPEIRASLAAAMGEDFAASWLAGARFDAERRALLTRTGFAADELRRAKGLREAGVLVIEKGSGL